MNGAIPRIYLKYCISSLVLLVMHLFFLNKKNRKKTYSCRNRNKNLRKVSKVKTLFSVLHEQCQAKREARERRKRQKPKKVCLSGRRSLEMGDERDLD